MLQTRSQQLAKDVYERVKAVSSSPDKSKYGSMAHKLPVLIRTAGLAQALAFVETGEPIHQQLLNDLSQTVNGGGDLSAECRDKNTSLQEYMLLTQKTLAALLWYKRFSQSVLKVKSGADVSPPGSSVATGENAR